MKQPNLVNLLEGEWLDKHTYQTVLPQFSNISSFREETIPFTHLNDVQYWGSLRSVNNIFLARFDFRHWLYDDRDFLNYVNHIANIGFPAVAISTLPYGHEYPSSIPIDIYEKKLFERTKIAAEMIRERQPKTLLLSPAIDLIDRELNDRYIEYFMHNRSYFNIYAMHCCYDMDEKSTAILTSLLNEVLTILPKDVWVTRWAIPSCEHIIESPQSFVDTAWRPPSYAEACSKTRHVFSAINTVARNRAKWFFTGVGKDDYDPGIMTHSFWKTSPHLHYSYSGTWNCQHFMGLITHDGEVKEPVLQVILDLAKKN